MWIVRQQRNVLMFLCSLGLGAAACAADDAALDEAATTAEPSAATTEQALMTAATNAFPQMLNQDKGYFAGGTPLHFGLPPTWQLVTGDFDGDGRLDYARLGDVDSFVFYGTADGTLRVGYFDYRTVTDTHFGVPSMWQVVSGDFDGDGFCDYARLGSDRAMIFYGLKPVPNQPIFNMQIQMYASLPSTLQIPSFGQPSSWQVASGDFDNDGHGDYIRLGDTRSFVFYGGPRTTMFTAVRQNYNIPNFGLSGAWGIVTGDFDGDHRTDYIRLGSTEEWVYSGNANRTFQQDHITHPDLGFGFHSVWQTITGDFDNDQKDDFMRIGDTAAFVAFGSAVRGSFVDGLHNYSNLALPLNFGFGQWQAIAGDFDGDQHDDYAMLGDQGAWIIHHIQKGSTFTINFDTYASPIHFGTPTAWQSISGHFRNTTRDSYLRLGDDRQIQFFVP